MARRSGHSGAVTLLATALALLCATTAVAQTYQLARVRVVGARRLAPAVVSRMTGLAPATLITARDVERARARLLESGLFAEIGYSFRMDGHALTVTFSVSEPPWDARIVFDNFIWFTDEELTAAVARVLPGFSGLAPTLPQSLAVITNALQGAVRARGIAGNVTHVLGGGVASDSPAYLFRLDRPETMPVCRIDFEGVAPVFAIDTNLRVRSAIGQSYSRDFLERLIGASVLSLYGQRGYLKASIGAVRARPVDEDGCRGGVAVTVPIAEGRQYTWGGATWVGIGETPPGELDALLAMSADAPVDTERLAASLQRVRDHFARQGYFATVVKRTFTFSDTDGRATAAVTVTRGPRVTLGSFSVQGLPGETSDRVAALWSHPIGVYYDALYVSEFLKAVRAQYPDVFKLYPQTSVTTTPTSPGQVAVTITFSR
jgi:outer membrane protein assembly factor BamA